MSFTLAVLVLLIATAALLIYGLRAGGRRGSAVDFDRSLDRRPVRGHGRGLARFRRRTSISDREIGPTPAEGPVSSKDPGTPAETGRRRSA
jgi:hypothetical protein